MKTFAFCFVALFAGALALPVFDDNKVVGGADTTIEQHPHLLSLRRNGTHFCGATVLSTTSALTTASCLIRHDSNSLFSIQAGSTLVSGDANAQVRPVLRIVRHPEFNATGLRSDVAILYWDQPLTLGATVANVTLPAQDAPVPAGQNGTLTGWGRLSFNGTIPDVLQAASKPVITNEACNERYPDRVFSDMLCAGGLPQGGVGACTGDAGSPLRVGNVVVGLVSWGRGGGCALPNSPVVYARVAAFTNWILTNA